MKTIWSGSISTPPGGALQGCFAPISSPISRLPSTSGITLSSRHIEDSRIPNDVELRLLSIVETARIPLHLIAGSPCHVTTTDAHTAKYFSSVLLAEDGTDEHHSWWDAPGTDSPLAILAAAYSPSLGRNKIHARQRVTELLFYASTVPSAQRHHLVSPLLSSPSSSGPQRSGEVKVFALPLSSDLLYRSSELTPPASPGIRDAGSDAVFLPPLCSLANKDDIVHELQPRKRRTAGDAFDEATERRRKARRKGGESVAAAAANQTKSEPSLPTLKHRRSTSNSHVPLQSRPLSRASSISSLRPTTAREPSLPPISRPSGLSNCQTLPATSTSPEQPSIEQKNKEYVSKMVMSGMRLRGLVQRRQRKSRANSVVGSPNLDASFEEIESESKRDEEYKLLYHQVYKGTCFAFRQHMSLIALQSSTVALQETVEKLLVIFLSDPLVMVLPEDADDCTPGGRKAFGSSALPEKIPANPFLPPSTFGESGTMLTPSMRKPGLEYQESS